MTATTAQADLDRYLKGMVRGDCDGCLAIERKYGLDGYTPEAVTIWLRAEADAPGSGDKALTRFFDGPDPDQYGGE